MAFIAWEDDTGIVRRTQFVVIVAGTDISTRLASRLLKLEVMDKAGAEADTVSIELSDPGGQLVLPSTGVQILVSLGTAETGLVLVFDGVVDDVHCILDRGGGRRLRIDGKTVNTHGEAKTPVRRHWDGATYGQALQDAAKKAGITMTVHPSLASKKPDSGYIAQDNESFLHLGERIARELGGTFKLIGGNRAVMLPRNDGQSAGTGAALGTISAIVGKNLITCSVSPEFGRPQYKQITARWYDRKQSKWVSEKVQVPDADVSASGERLYPRSGKTAATDSATGRKTHSQRERGAGTVRILGNPLARAEMFCVISGVRPGLDGTYIADTVTHMFDRSAGYETNIDIKRPGGSAGKDSRRASTKRMHRSKA